MSHTEQRNSKDTSAQQLQTAFAAFNSASSTLTEQYLSLERRISVLTGQLINAHNERDHELNEKKRLAQRLSGILSALPGGVLFFAGNGILLDWNKKAAELLGIDLNGQSWQQIVDRCFTKGVLCTGEVVLANGKSINLSIQELENDVGKIVLLSDITESRNLQEGLKHRERLSEIGQMVGKLAHQIRTPLASAFLYLSKIRKSRPSENNKVVDKMHQCLTSIQHTLDDLLLYVRGQNPVMSYCSVDTVVKNVKTAFAAIATAKAVKLHCTDRTSNRYIYINRSALEGAILNLVHNAVQAGADEIKVAIEPKDSQILIVVNDNGSGIPKPIQGKVFDAFFTTRSNGTGLGLAIVKTVAQLHGGKVSVTSSSQDGTQFVVELPNYSQQCFIGSGSGSNQAASIN